MTKYGKFNIYCYCTTTYVTTQHRVIMSSSPTPQPSTAEQMAIMFAPAWPAILKEYGTFNNFLQTLGPDSPYTTTRPQSLMTAPVFRNETSAALRLMQVKDHGLYAVSYRAEQKIHEVAAENKAEEGGSLHKDCIQAFYENINPPESEFFLQRAFAGGDASTKREFRCLTIGSYEVATGAAKREGELGEFLFTDYTATRFICVRVMHLTDYLCPHELAKAQADANRIYCLALYMGE
jgi:hypothetical protein